MNRELYSQARIHRNRNFDGQFFFAVKTTGIFCRPSCPSPRAKEDHVSYYTSIFDAMDDGYRPCLRCRPDLHSDYCQKALEGGVLVEHALSLIYDGYLITHSLVDLAEHLYTSQRNLRQLFNDHLGLAPSKVVKYHRGLFARRLLLTSAMPITDIAYASGFSSIRQFNDVFKRLYHTSPSSLRSSSKSLSPPQGGLLIPYDDNFSFSRIISFMQPRALSGVELINDHSYSRTFRINQTIGFFTVRDQPVDHHLLLSIHCDDVRVYMPIFQQVKRMFDLYTDFTPINNLLMTDPLLAKGMDLGRVPRLPVAYNPFEFVIRAILGQVVSVTFATTLAIRLVERSGQQTPDNFPGGLSYFFPTPEELQAVDLQDMGMTRTKIATIDLVIKALNNGTLSLSPHQSLEAFIKSFVQLKGIGDWTANYVAMRGLGLRDAFPYNDLAIIKALSTNGHKASNKEIKERAKAWSPYRAYATMCLWHG